MAKAGSVHRAAVERFNQVEADKRGQLAKLKAEYDQSKELFETEVQRRNAEVSEFEAAYIAKEPDAIVAYNEMVLARSGETAGQGNGHP
ncbi:hypothetical protein [Pusillimonas sp.]|uniref:hypothetical protein n=1 Tax=Pusillimonas sp. TaxID=3040095 RepID=UPI0029A7590A|nr:hypothetical protein [Pusillimonas sp.]MDX3895748.1 hypothetical protein [Pusillimonas sp.]